MARVLIVDDEPHVRRILAALLLDQRHEVAEVGSGEEALARLESFAADLLMLDLNLPGIDGIETLRRLREQGHQAAAILMTTFGTIASAPTIT
jgi:CheY-like chemotaxis protein